MLYLNRYSNKEVQTFRYNLTLTSVVFEFGIMTTTIYKRPNLTLTSVVFELDNTLFTLSSTSI